MLVQEQARGSGGDGAHVAPFGFFGGIYDFWAQVRVAANLKMKEKNRNPTD
jgi:hypothetical protein